MSKILIVEDEEAIADLEKDYLELSGFDVEIENEKRAHIKDGVAVTRFIYWLKHTIGKEPITELSASKKLESLRAEGEHYLEQSFDPILAYGAHGAIVHYEPTEETDIPMEPRGLCLADTGNGRATETRGIPAAGLGCAIPGRHYRHHPHHRAGAAHGRGKAHLHACPARTHTAGRGQVPARLHGRKP